MILGFTGSRNQPTETQLFWLNLKMRGIGMTEFHHGACVGSDEAAHNIAKDYGARIIVHPPTNEKLMMAPDFLVWNWLPAKDYHSRNRDIVNAAGLLLALPDGPRRPHSGTWYTIDYAAEHDVPGWICFPDGSVKPIKKRKE